MTAALDEGMREFVERQALLLRFHGFVDCPRCAGARDEALLFGSCKGRYLVAGCIRCGYQQIRTPAARS